MMAHYYALITHIDAEVGRLFAELKRRDLFENTLIVFFSDHGEMLGEHGATTKRVLYDGSVKVPFIVSWPRFVPPAFSVSTPFGGVDLLPTVLDLAGVACPSRLDGRSVAADILAGREPEPQPIFAEIASWQAIHGETNDADWKAAHVMVRDGPWKYVRNRFDTDELYDLETDPHEMKNVATTPEQRHRIAALNNTLAKMLQRTGPGPYRWCLG